MLYNKRRMLCKLVLRGDRMYIKSILKTLCIIIITISIILCLDNMVFAIDTDYFEPDMQENQDELNSRVGKIFGIVSTIGTIMSVIIIMIIGVRYMVGSIEEKAEYKKTIVTYLIGAVLLFGATTLPSIIYNIMYPEETTSSGGGPGDSRPVTVYLDK